MGLRELIDSIKKVKVMELRNDKDDFFEAVVMRRKLIGLSTAFKECFGAPVWPLDKRLPLQLIRKINKHGGIREGQTLYVRRNAKHTVVAMLWPWQDNIHTTVKIIKWNKS
jgi:hypothetical protein